VSLVSGSGLLVAVGAAVFLYAGTVGSVDGSTEMGASSDSRNDTEMAVTEVAKELATYFVDNNGPLRLQWRPEAHQIEFVQDDPENPITSNAISVDVDPEFTIGSSGAHATSANDWCVDLASVKHRDRIYQYSAWAGLTRGACPAVAPPG
jgi:hypothetical protein